LRLAVDENNLSCTPEDKGSARGFVRQLLKTSVI
jgi:hypothetical protein